MSEWVRAALTPGMESGTKFLVWATGMQVFFLLLGWRYHGVRRVAWGTPLWLGSWLGLANALDAALALQAPQRGWVLGPLAVAMLLGMGVATGLWISGLVLAPRWPPAHVAVGGVVACSAAAIAGLAVGAPTGRLFAAVGLMVVAAWGVLRAVAPRQPTASG